MKPTLLFLLLTALPAFSQEADKQALRDLKATYEKAIAEGNLSLIEPHLAADFSAVMITAGDVKNYDGIVAYW